MCYRRLTELRAQANQLLFIGVIVTLVGSASVVVSLLTSTIILVGPGAVGIVSGVTCIVIEKGRDKLAKSSENDAAAIPTISISANTNTETIHQPNVLPDYRTVTNPQHHTTISEIPSHPSPFSNYPPAYDSDAPSNPAPAIYSIPDLEPAPPSYSEATVSE